MSVEPGIRPGTVEAALLLDISGASIAYGKVRAVEGASLRVGAGEIVTVIGANGAGKSTLLNAAMGVLPLAAGAMSFLGRDVSRLAVEERVALGLSLVPERRELFSTMSVEDNLVLGGFRVARATARDTLAEVYDRFPRLKERRRQLAGTMSGGERQMLAMGRALMGRPKLLMLDEPSLGLAPRIVADVFRIIADLRASGVSILLVEQNARAALAAADVAHVMELGTVTLSGPAAVLARDARVIESYLGLH
ncbi:ABC transporter ATP-binding protein [Xanthobacter sp. AM11]|uniref:ABC transporter ATP-binding protein n=1 Tax=Xanthobacter sp. AM11 TaxID=3380643 RepID=UPI0039BFDD63